jgi:replicative DNA helicase
MTGGLRFGTVTAFVARPSVGKSSIIVLIAKHAWELADRNERVLIVSPEMSAQDMAERHFVIDAQVPYMSVVRGQLSGFEEPKLWAAMDRVRGEDRLWIVDGVTSDLTERSIEAAIKAVRPTLVCVDSFYDLNFPGRDDNERVRAIARWVFGSCKRHRYACVVGSQQNRDQEKSKALGGGSRLGTIAFSDAIGQRFDAIMALERDERLKQARKIRVRPIKIRRGFGLDPVVLHWDFSSADFSEAEGGAADGFDDEEGGAGAGKIPY